ncbi:MAG: DUF4097 family beta strand repeat protein [Nocardioidaceae bacterium]|nr:DUF4097 family beta strand repeat protein [Nocardioidaceae bacterium]
MYEFHASDKVRLRIEFGSGDIALEASETDRVRIDLTGDGESGGSLVDQTVIEQRGDEVVVDVPRRTGFLRRSPSLDLRVVVPLGTRVDVKADAVDIDATGRLGDTQIKIGSGDLRLDHTADVRVQTGSGDVTLGTADGTATLSTGSGDVTCRALAGLGRVNSGSGDIRIERAGGPLQVNSASGDISIDDAADDVTVDSASGDQHLSRVTRGRVRLNSASGDLHVGVADGTPVWLDVNTLTGSVSSALSGGEPPGDGEAAVELRVNTVSGDISLART